MVQMSTPLSRSVALPIRVRVHRKTLTSLLWNGIHSHQSHMSSSHRNSSSRSHLKTDDTSFPPATRGTQPLVHPAAVNSTPFDYDLIRKEIFSYWMKAHASSPQGQVTTARYCCYTHNDAQRAYLHPSTTWHWLDGELSSNLAGETGAVHIYKGAMDALSLRQRGRQQQQQQSSSTSLNRVVEFCQEHKMTEESHLQMFEFIVPKEKRTRLLPVWKVAGWTLGFVPTLLGGARALYVTVEAVETFVEQHFKEQIKILETQKECPRLVELLKHCCEDEIHHKQDAKEKLLNSNDFDEDALGVKAWATIVKGGSALAADIARRM